MEETLAPMEEAHALRSSPTRFLMRVMKDEKAKSKGNLGRLFIAVHAVFLDSGFVLSDAGAPLLPDGWHSPSATVSVRYTLPDLLVSPSLESNGSGIILTFSATVFDVSIYGSLDEPDSEICRVSFDISKLAGPLIKSMHGMNEKEEKEVLKLWRTVKDELSRPLLIEICSKNGLPVPYDLMSLPQELKTLILNFLPGVDLARIQCVSVEWKELASSDRLWKQKFEEGSGRSAMDSAIWKMIARNCVPVENTWKQNYARWWISMRRNAIDHFREHVLIYQSRRRGQDLVPATLGLCGVLRPQPSRNPRRPEDLPACPFHSCTCRPLRPCTCLHGSARCLWFNMWNIW